MTRLRRFRERHAFVSFLIDLVLFNPLSVALMLLAVGIAVAGIALAVAYLSSLESWALALGEAAVVITGAVARVLIIRAARRRP